MSEKNENTLSFKQVGGLLAAVVAGMIVLAPFVFSKERGYKDEQARRQAQENKQEIKEIRQEAKEQRQEFSKQFRLLVTTIHNMDKTVVGQAGSIESIKKQSNLIIHQNDKIEAKQDKLQTKIEKLLERK